MHENILSFGFYADVFLFIKLLLWNPFYHQSIIQIDRF